MPIVRSDEIKIETKILCFGVLFAPSEFISRGRVECQFELIGAEQVDTERRVLR